eukprot:389816_1
MLQYMSHCQCGFNYYFNTFNDAINNESRITIDWENSIGGNCLNCTDTTLCVCTNEFFAGPSCRDSCSGVIGPIYNHETALYESANSTTHIGNYTLYMCNGNGLCDLYHKQCECDSGFG